MNVNVLKQMNKSKIYITATRKNVTLVFTRIGTAHRFFLDPEEGETPLPPSTALTLPKGETLLTLPMGMYDTVDLFHTFLVDILFFIGLNIVDLIFQ